MPVNQKLENLLNLSLDTTAEERSRSSELETGYNQEEQTWGADRKILRESGGGAGAWCPGGGNAQRVRDSDGKESQIPLISALPQIEYIEKPKRLFFAVDQAKTASCVNLLQEAPPYLSGRGVLIAVLDSGVDYFHEAFRRGDGTTRILGCGIRRRTGFIRKRRSTARWRRQQEAARQVVSSADVSGHGTAVAGIAAGDSRGAQRKEF